MSTDMPTDGPHSDAELAQRTAQLLAAAEKISRELVDQTEQLAITLAAFTRDKRRPAKPAEEGDDDV